LSEPKSVSQSGRPVSGPYTKRRKRRSEKTALHISARRIRGVFGVKEAALLTQGNDDKAKSAESCRRNAMRIRVLLP